MKQDFGHGRRRMLAQVLEGQFKDRPLGLEAAIEGLVPFQFAQGVGGLQGYCRGRNAVDLRQDPAALAGQPGPNGFEPGIGDNLAPEGLSGDAGCDVGLAQAVFRLTKPDQGATGAPALSAAVIKAASVAREVEREASSSNGPGRRRRIISRRRSAPSVTKAQVSMLAPADSLWTSDTDWPPSLGARA